MASLGIMWTTLYKVRLGILDDLKEYIEKHLRAIVLTQRF